MTSIGYCYVLQLHYYTYISVCHVRAAGMKEGYTCQPTDPQSNPDVTHMLNFSFKMT